MTSNEPPEPPSRSHPLATNEPSSLQCLLDLTTSGLKTSGLTTSGLSTSGLTTSGLSTSGSVEAKPTSRSQIGESNLNSDLIREAHERIEFCLPFDDGLDTRGPGQAFPPPNNQHSFHQVKEDLSQVKQEIFNLKNDLHSAEKPLLVSPFFHRQHTTGKHYKSKGQL